MIKITKTKLSEILELLDKKDLTSKEIYEELGIPKENLWIYLNTLLKKNRIIRLNDKKPYVYRTMNFEEDLKKSYIQLSNFSIDLINYFEKNDSIQKKKLRELINKNINDIEKMIKINKFLG